MSLRSICFLLCLSIVCISAFPGPQDVSDDEFTTEDPSLQSEELFLGQETGIDEAVEGENEQDKPAGTNESENEEPKSNEDEEATTGEPIPVEENAEAANAENEDSDTTSEKETPDSDTDGKKPAEEPAVDDQSDTKHELSDEESNGGDSGNRAIELSSIIAYGYQLNAVEEDRGNEKMGCQLLLGKNEEVIDKKCVVLKSSYFVLVDEKIINSPNVAGGDKYVCQEIVSVSDGPIQELCVTYDGWIFNPVNIQDDLTFFW